MGDLAEIVAGGELAPGPESRAFAFPQHAQPFRADAERRRLAVAHEGLRLFGGHAAEAAGFDGDRGAVLLDDLGFYEIHASEEVGNLAVDRALVDLLGLGDLRDSA